MKKMISRIKIFTYPNLGLYNKIISNIFERLDVKFIPPKPITNKKFEIGMNLLDEFLCLPIKTTLADFIEGIKEGANCLITFDSCGICRFKSYHIIQKQILKKQGYDVDFYVVTFKNLIADFKKVNPKNSYWKVIKVLWQAWKEIKLIEKTEWMRNKNKEIKIAITGEIYTCLEEKVNMEIISKLRKFGCYVHNYTNLSYYIKHSIFSFFTQYGTAEEKEARCYFSTGYKIGGHGFESIVNTIKAKKEGYDCVIHVLPAFCMPETTVTDILDIVSEDYDIPVKHFIFDGQSGEAGVETRIESLVDILRFKKEGIATKKQKISENDKPCHSAILGIDIGSVSTKAILMSDDLTIKKQIYIETEGDPIKAVQQCLDNLKSEKVIVSGVGITGSGRKIIGKIIGADLIKNEITAQTIANVNYNPDVRTIIEIGGQDSKVIQVKHGIPVWYNMNTICSAGTGSFLTHQSKRMKLDIDTFANMGCGGCATKINGRCGVFAESDLIHKQSFNKKEDLIAGLNKALVLNYLKNVTKNRKLESPVLFSGGVASNKGIKKCFEEELHTEIIVPEFHKIMGCIGIALLTKEYMEKNNLMTKFKGFDLVKSNFETRYNECGLCGNMCDISFIYEDGVFTDSFGNRCDKFMEKFPDIQNQLFTA